MPRKYIFLALMTGVLTASTATFAATASTHHPAHPRSAVTATPPAQQPEHAPPPSFSWVLPQGWPHTP